MSLSCVLNYVLEKLAISTQVKHISDSAVQILRLTPKRNECVCPKYFVYTKIKYKNLIEIVFTITRHWNQSMCLPEKE